MNPAQSQLVIFSYPIHIQGVDTFPSEVGVYIYNTVYYVYITYMPVLWVIIILKRVYIWTSDYWEVGKYMFFSTPDQSYS